MSDGTLQPEVLAARAKANGVELWALTDHDEICGQRSARVAAQAIGLPYFTSIEISVTFADVTVRIVGLGFDADNTALHNGLLATRGGRRERALEMSAGLAKVGIHCAFEGAQKYVSNPELISRTHFALEVLGQPLLATTLIAPGDDTPMNDPRAIRDRFEKLIQVVVDAGACPMQPTTVVGLTQDPAQLVRQGRGDAWRLGSVA